MSISETEVIDCHMHVGVLGDQWPQYGRLSPWYRQQLAYKIFLFYAGISPDQVSDRVLHEATVRVLSSAGVNRAVCLALDHVHDRNGNPRPDASHVWVANEYVVKLCGDVKEKALYGASVHPFSRGFKDRVDRAVHDGAVLLKWLPSAQQFSLGDPLVGEALEHLAVAHGGKPLPLLLHCGPEYAVPTSDEKTWTYDFISWNILDRINNIFKKRHTPDVDGIERNFKRALDAGGVIIFAHCGLPYFSSGWFGNLLEHSDFDRVKEWLQANNGASCRGRCFADVSALCTPMRKTFFSKVADLPSGSLFFGSDFPTPAFELNADAEEVKRDFEAMINGHLERIIVPQDNLLDVNFRQLQQAFPGHPLFTNFARMLASS